MEHARKHRQPNPEFNGIPDTIVCTNSGESKKVVKANVLKYAKADNISIEDYVKNFQCPTCNPRKKGRQTSGKYALLPKSLVCHFEGCNKVLVQHPSMTEKQAQAAGVGFNEFCEKWMCKEHRPKKAHYFSKEARENRGEKVNIPVKGTNEPKMGTGRRGRQASEKWAGMASELKCNHEGCTKIQKQHPSLTMAAAKRHGKTFEEFLNTWKCKEHRKEQKSSSTV
jgi:rubredoxin